MAINSSGTLLRRNLSVRAESVGHRNAALVGKVSHIAALHEVEALWRLGTVGI